MSSSQNTVSVQDIATSGFSASKDIGNKIIHTSPTDVYNALKSITPGKTWDVMKSVWDGVLEKTGMTPYQAYGMIANMGLGVVAEGRVPGFSLFNEIGMLADMYDVDDSQKIPTRDYLNTLASQYFVGYEGNHDYMSDTYYTSHTPGTTQVTPAIRQSDDYKKKTSMYDQVSRYYTIKHFQPSDLNVDTCTYMNVANLSQPITDDSGANPFLPYEYSLDTGNCPSTAYQNYYQDYYVKNHPDNQVYDCQVSPAYLDISKLFDQNQMVETTQTPSTASINLHLPLFTTGCVFELVNSKNQLDLAGTYALVTRPITYDLTIGTPSRARLANSLYGKYVIDPRNASSSTTNFSSPIQYLELTNTGPVIYTGAYAPYGPYYVIQFGTSTTFGLVTMEPFPRIFLATQSGKDYIPTGDILQYSPNCMNTSGLLDLGGIWKVKGSRQLVSIGTRSSSNVSTIAYQDVASQYRLDGSSLVYDMTTPLTVSLNGLVGSVSITPIPNIMWADGSMWEWKGLGSYYKYAYRNVQLPRNGGAACDPMYTLDGGLAMERVPCHVSDTWIPTDCSPSTAWYNPSIDSQGVKKKLPGWSVCYQDTGACAPFASRMPSTNDEWGIWEAYKCWQKDASGKMDMTQWYQTRQFDGSASQTTNCNNFQIRSNYDPNSECSIRKDCTYGTWSDPTGCFVFNDSDLAYYNGVTMTSGKPYMAQWRDVVNDGQNGGIMCDTSSWKDRMKVTECPVTPCVLSDWKVSDCFMDSDGVAKQYKYKDVVTDAVNGGSCVLPDPTLVPCAVTNCSFSDWSNWSQCLPDESGKYVQYRARKVTNTPANTICTDTIWDKQTCAGKDCQLGTFSDWGACLPYGGTDAQYKGKKVHMSIANILQEPQYGGKGCGPTVRYKLC